MNAPTPFVPVVDVDVLPEAPWSALARGAACDVDLLVGHIRDEYGERSASTQMREGLLALAAIGITPPSVPMAPVRVRRA